MTHTASRASSSKAGAFASLRAFHRIPLRGASSHRPSALFAAACVAILALAAFLASPTPPLAPPPAHAGTVTNERPFLFSFDGSGTTAGRFEMNSGHIPVAVDEESGDVYVLDSGHEAIDRFDAEGHATNFTAGPAAGTSSLYGTPTELFKEQSPYSFFGWAPGLAVDNSGLYGGPGAGEHGEQGRLYVSGSSGPIDAFGPQGNFLWTLPRTTVAPCGIAVDPEGHLWVGAGKKVLEFANTGSPPAQIGEFEVTSGSGDACNLALDRSRSVYAALGTLDKYTETAPGEWGYSSTLDPNKPWGVAVDQSSAAGHVFAAGRRDERQTVTVNATSGKFKLTFHGETTTELPFNAPAQGGTKPSESVRNALEALPSIDVAGLGEVEGGPGGTKPYLVQFTGPNASTNVEQLTCESGTPPLGGGSGCSVATVNDGAPGGFQEYEPGGGLLGSFGRDLIGAGRGIAYSGYEPPGEGPLDRLYVFDAESQSVKAFGPLAGGTVPDVSCQQVEGVTRFEATARCTINPREVADAYHLEWSRPVSEIQRVRVYEAWGGTFRLASGGPSPQWTEPMPFDVSPEAMQAELEALPAYGPGNVSVTGTPSDGKQGNAGAGQYTVTFEGELAGLNLLRMGSDGSGLTGRGLQLVEVNPPGFADITQGREAWATAQSSSPQSVEPTDGADHQVSLTLTNLRQNANYQLRLVGTNTENDLSAYSAPVNFKTEPPPPPTVSGLAISSITTSSAHLAATIDPQMDEATWRILLAARPHATTQAQCEALPESAFKTAKEGTIPTGEPGTVALSQDLTGLPPAQLYCVRLSARNAGGTGTGNTKFTTLTVPPAGALTAFAAPRTDTSARLNAYVNPQGEALTYRFEYSADDGSTWTVMPDETNESEARREIVVATELTGLQPGTTYRYRLAAAFNPAGSAPGLPAAELEFTTRTEAEIAALDPPSCPNAEVRANRHFAYLPQCRGVELVNSPDDGNQNVRAEVSQGTPPLSPGGERALWNVNGGAPGGNSGAGATFLARRTGQSEAAPTGWQSRSLIPPAAQQVEAEEGSYGLGATTPDLAHFLFVAGGGSASAGHTLVRLDAAGSQDVLKRYPQPAQAPSNADLTSDGAHVLRVETSGSGSEEQLEDIGAARVGPPEVPGEVLSRLPNGSLPECGLGSEGESFVGGGSATGAAPQWRPGYHLIDTTDASRVYFQVNPNGQCAGNPPWWLLERNREAKEGKGKTLQVAPPDRSNALIRATPDGRSVYFVSALALDPADTNTHIDVYRWDEAPGGLSGTDTCLTCGVENEAGEVIADANLRTYNGVSTPVMVSDDFSHLYFESESKLTPQASAGEANVYTVSDGQIRFVATPNSPPGAGTLDRGLGSGQAELSGDGNVLVFETTEAGNHDLTADRLAASCPDPQTGTRGPCRELFRYDDRDRSLECISCRQGATTTAMVGSNGGNDFQISADGETVAFVTAQALTPRDVNDGPDLYEWRSGEVRLITDGVSGFGQRDTAALQPYALSEDGRDILFKVVDPGLTGFEQNRFANLYDARIDGGFEVPPAPVHCSEESCQGPLQAAPALEQPASTGLTRGNVEEPSGKPRCRKGKVRRRGKCVPKHRRHRRTKHHRRSHKRAANANGRAAR